MYSRSSDFGSTPRRTQAEARAGEDVEAARRRRRLALEIGNSLRELNSQLSLLNYRVGAQVALRDVDLDCLDLIDRLGPLSPSALARMAGLHPATVTGILDRLERGGWIARERDPADRRAVLVRANRDRGGGLFRLYAGVDSSLDHLLAGYGGAEVDVLADVLGRAAEPGRAGP